MRIIDVHTHVFPNKIAEKTIDYLSKQSGTKPNTNGTVEGLENSMKEAGIDLSLVMPVVTNNHQFDTILKFALEINEKYEHEKHRIISFAGIHPETDNYIRQLNLIKKEGFMGIKLHPDYQGYFIDDIRYQRIIDEASSLGLVVLVHAGKDIGYPEPVHCPPDRALKMINEVKPDKLILAHMGGWKQWDMVEELLVNQDIWLDTAFSLEYCDKDQLIRLFEKKGYDKILFASDSPWSNQSQYVDIINNMELEAENREKIFATNAKKLLNIKE